MSSSRTSGSWESICRVDELLFRTPGLSERRIGGHQYGSPSHENPYALRRNGPPAPPPAERYIFPGQFFVCRSHC